MTLSTQAIFATIFLNPTKFHFSPATVYNLFNITDLRMSLVITLAHKKQTNRIG